MTVTQQQHKLLRFIAILALLAVILVSTSCVSQDKYNSLQAELTSTQGQLQDAQSQLQDAQSQLSQLRDELSSTQDQVDSLSQQVTTLQNQLNLYKASGIIVQSGVQPNYSLGLGQSVHLVSNPNATNPTWQQLKTFINLDKTDQMAYIPGGQECGTFAEEVYNNAEKYLRNFIVFDNSLPVAGCVASTGRVG